MTARTALARALVTAAVLAAGCGDTTADVVTRHASDGASPPAECRPSDCPAARPLCSASTGACVACLSSADCTRNEALLCDVARGECVECVGDQHCDPGERCSAGLGRCAAPCTTADDCRESEERVCDPTLRVCVGCTTTADCDGDETCVRGTCAAGPDGDQGS